MRYFTPIPVLALATAALLAGGCGSHDLKLVKGKVTYNGQPLGDAQVEFVPREDRSIGAFGGGTNADGTFEIKLGKGTGKYAKAGNYVALVTKDKPITAAVPDAMMTEEERMRVQMKMMAAVAAGTGPGSSGASIGILPPAYASSATSPFKFTLTEGDNDIGPLDLKGPPLKK
jgi:hypothetical protein